MPSHLSNHAVPNAPDELAMLAIGYKVEVIRELDVAGKFLQNVDAKPFTAQFGVWLGMSNDPIGKGKKITS